MHDAELHANTHRDRRVDDLYVRFFNEDLARLDAQPLDVLFGDRLAAVELLDLPVKHAHRKTRTRRHPSEGRRRGRASHEEGSQAGMQQRGPYARSRSRRG